MLGRFAITHTQANTTAQFMFTWAMCALSQLSIITQNHLGNVD